MVVWLFYIGIKIGGNKMKRDDETEFWLAVLLILGLGLFVVGITGVILTWLGI